MTYPDPESLIGKIIAFYPYSNGKLHVFHVYSVNRFGKFNDNHHLIGGYDMTEQSYRNFCWDRARNSCIVDFPDSLINKTIQFTYLGGSSPGKQRRVKVNDVKSVNRYQENLLIRGDDLELMQPRSFQLDKMRDLKVVSKPHLDGVELQIHNLKRNLEKVVLDVENILARIEGE